MKKSVIKVKPVGGVGQIGSNMTLIEYASHHLLIDAGILFPYEDFFDISYLIPNLSQVEKIDSLIITHGHEDHIGAVYNIIQKYPGIKIYAPRFAAALIRKKLEYNKAQYPISVYQESDTLTFSDLTIDPIHVNHSIPDTKGLLIRLATHSISMFFVSDFKIDAKTTYEKFFDFEKLKTLTKNYARKILFADSTNITSSTLETPSEFDLIPSFEEVISKSNNRIFITLFSSNIHRIHTILNLAEKYQFKVVPYGRSMISYINSATEEGILPSFEKTIKMSDSVKNKDENLIVLLSGCQGDFLGTFRRVSLGEDSLFKPRSTDTFIISSKSIPGNEKKINLLLNKISEMGIKIVSPSNTLIHVSGHPGKNDLKKLYDEFLPTDIIPIHGETHFLREHVDYIKKVAPYSTPHLILNHDEMEIDESTNLTFTQGTKLDPVIYHGNHIVLEKEKISERRKLACNGVVFISIKYEPFKNLHSVSKVQLLGVSETLPDFESHFKSFMDNEISSINFKDIEKAQEELRVSVRRYFNYRLGYKPTTVVHII